MEWFETFGAIFLGVLVRFGIPVAVTALIVWWFRNLDQRWQFEVQPEERRGLAQNPGCWDIKNCPPELQANCKAYANPDKPCWQVFRGSNGRLREKCLSCDVFKRAPVPLLS